MNERPILRLPIRSSAQREKRKSRGFRRLPKGPSLAHQTDRFGPQFQRLAEALSSQDPGLELRNDPVGLSPDRALVFEVGGSIQEFARVARVVGMEVFAEVELEETEELPEGFQFAPGTSTLRPCLYATMSKLDTLRTLLGLWQAYEQGEKLPHGKKPWAKVFSNLKAIRRWGPKDRLPDETRTAILDRLPEEGDAEAFIEVEMWPTARNSIRQEWAAGVEERVSDLGGRIVDRCLIDEDEFGYNAMLVGLPADTLRAMLDDRETGSGLATLDGIQFVLPQTIAQGLPIADATAEKNFQPPDEEVRTPVSLDPTAVLLDGTPVAAHPALRDAVSIEDIHDLVSRSEVRNRSHATAMASLILRGDLEADGEIEDGAQLISVPILVDDADGASTAPGERLFVDVVHRTLQELFEGDEPKAPEAFVVSFSIGVRNSHFSGIPSALARLLDWWSWKSGVLFVVSAGNVSGGLGIPDTTLTEFESISDSERATLVWRGLFDHGYARTLLAPAEAMNVLTIGAVSYDLSSQDNPKNASLFRIDTADDGMPQITSAVGLGMRRSLKPDLVHCGGAEEFRFIRSAHGCVLHSNQSSRTGVVAAAARGAPEGATARIRGTSAATALTTRAVLQSVRALVGEGGPYSGEGLSRLDAALLARALAANASRWPDSTARELYDYLKSDLGITNHVYLKEIVGRHYGYGVLDPNRMVASPALGATLVATDSILKDESRIFELPLPPSMSGERAPRSLQVSLAWFSPVRSSRALYRAAKLHAISSAGEGQGHDTSWGLKLKPATPVCPDANMISRGTLWSARLKHKAKPVPEYSDGTAIPIRVQCEEGWKNALTPETEIRFAIAVSLEIEVEAEYDVFEEIRERVMIRARRSA